MPTTLECAEFGVAIKNAQQAAKIDGLQNNYALRARNGKIVGGLMQPLDVKQTGLNHRVNAFFTRENGKANNEELSKIYSDKSNSKTQLAAEDFQGVILYSFGKIETPISVKNPYALPNYADINLIDNLPEVEISDIPYIFMPILNYTIPCDLMQLYLQAALFLYAGNEIYSCVDIFTPTNLKLGRSMQLTCAALEQYCANSDLVTLAFNEQSRSIVKCRLIQQIAFPHLQRFSRQLAAWIKQEVKQPFNPEKLAEYQAFLIKAEKIITRLTNNAIEYMSLIEQNSQHRWDTHLALGEKYSYAKPTNATELGLYIRDEIYLTQMYFWQARNLFNKYAKQTVFNLQQIISTATECKSNLEYLNILHLANLLANLVHAKSNPALRKAILHEINSTLLHHKGKLTKHEIITDDQLLQLYSFCLNNFVGTNFKQIIGMSPATNVTDLFLKRKSAYNITIEPDLVRSIILRRVNSGFRIICISSRKNHSGAKLLPKAQGAACKVTAEWDITPVNSIGTRIRASKVRLVKSSPMHAVKQDDVALIVRAIDIDRTMGTQVFCTQFYEKLNTSIIPAALKTVMRISEPWAKFTLANLLCYPDLYAQDISVQRAKASNNLIMLANALKIVKHRFALELAQQVEQLHKQNIVHQHIKPDNILIDFDTEGNMHARLMDFSLSVHKSEIDLRHKTVPKSTFNYISPQIYWLHDKGEHATGVLTCIYRDYFYIKDSNNLFIHACLARDFYIDMQEKIKDRKDYWTFKPDAANDMFSLGIVLIMLLVDQYPTLFEKPNSAEYYLTNYTRMPFVTLSNFYTHNPEYAFMARLFTFESSDRMTASQFVASFAAINKDTDAPTSDSRQKQQFSTP
jgi:serine/threonine protein kinase